MTSKLSDAVWCALNDFIKYDGYVMLENYGIDDDLLGDRPDSPDDVEIDDDVVLRAFPESVFDRIELNYKQTAFEFDDDAYSEVEQAVLAAYSNYHILDMWRDWYDDTSMTSSELNDLIYKMLCMPNQNQWSIIHLIVFAFENGLAELLPTSDEPDEYLKLEHLWNRWTIHLATLA